MHTTYLLILNMRTTLTTQVGALGKITFTKGNYIYIGSANNILQKRIERHLRQSKPLQWHIDYLTTKKEVEIEKILYKHSHQKEECRTARIISHWGSPIMKFGSSDCTCNSHLIRVKDIETMEWEDMGMREWVFWEKAK